MKNDLLSWRLALSDQIRGTCLLVGGVTVMALADNLVRFVSDDIGLGQFHLMRSAIALGCYILLSRVFPINFLPVNWKAALARSLLLTIAMVLFFATLSFLPVAIAGAGLFTSPIFVLVFSLLLFGQRLSWDRLGAVLCGSLGVWLMLRPDTQDFNLLQILPVLAGAFYALSSIITRKYCADESPFALSALFFVIIGGIGGSGALLFNSLALPLSNDQTSFLLRGFVVPDWPAIGWMTVISLLAVFGVWMLTRAYQIADTSHMSIYEYSYLISAGIIGWLIWRNAFAISDIFGIILIVIAGTVFTLLSAKRRRDEGG